MIIGSLLLTGSAGDGPTPTPTACGDPYPRPLDQEEFEILVEAVTAPSQANLETRVVAVGLNALNTSWSITPASLSKRLRRRAMIRNIFTITSYGLKRGRRSSWSLKKVHRRYVMLSLGRHRVVKKVDATGGPAAPPTATSTSAPGPRFMIVNAAQKPKPSLDTASKAIALAGVAVYAALVIAYRAIMKDSG